MLAEMIGAVPRSRLSLSVTTLALAVVAGGLALAGAATSPAAGPTLGDQLRRGGLVLVLRHAATDQSKQDDEHVDLADCGTQRMLSAEGRADARAIARDIRRLRLRVASVLTSAFCRTRETARLTFSRRATVSPALLNTIDAPHDAAWRRQLQAFRRLLGTRPPAGTVVAFVTHGVVVSDATGLSLEEGETLVFRPLGRSRFRLIGRILPRDWSVLRAPSSAGAAPRVREYVVPPGSHPHDVAPARDGTVWYTAQQSGELGLLDPQTGETRRISLGEGSAPHGVIVGPDGAAWVTDGGLNAIVRVDAATHAVKRFPLPSSSGWANLNTATFDRHGVLWFTGQSGVYGRLDPRTGAMRVFRAPGGAGPYGITTTPKGDVWYASLAGSHIARIDVGSGKATALRPPTAGQGARRIWSDSRGRLWVSEWNAGRVARYDPQTRRWREWRLPGAAQPYAVYVDEKDTVWLTDFGAGAIVRFVSATGRFTTLRLRAGANVRQLLGRRGEVWGAESGADRLVVIRNG
jgi:virginiamycin B lyase